MTGAQLTDLLRRHRGLIHRVAWVYCRRAADRDDVAQEIALQLWRARERYDPRYRESTWIYRIALNVAISYDRRERRHRDGATPLDEQVIVLEPITPSEEVEQLVRFIEGLNPFEKAIVLLYLDGNDHATIGDVLGISTSNVGTKLGRIKHRLRAESQQLAKETSNGPR